MQFISELVITSNPKATGFWNDLNTSQYETLTKFKQRILNSKLLPNLDAFDDLYLLRFCRARKFDLEKTFLMFSNFIQWRIDNQVDTIETFQFPELLEVKKYYIHGYHKTDKLGRPIYIEQTCKLNVTELFKATSEERLVKYYVKEYEKLLKVRFPSCSKEKGTLIDRSLTIMNVEGIGLSLLVGQTKKFLKLAADIAQDYYPEMLGTMFLINSSFAFNLVWSVAKGFIDAKTVAKFNLEKSKYQPKLLELVDEENLPSFFGGKCTCSHIEGGCMLADIGPWNRKGGLEI